MTKRYSELLAFHRVLGQEMKDFLKKKGVEQLPKFPPKKLLNNMDRQFVHDRIKKINTYFKQLFEGFPGKVPFTNALIDLCQPP